MEGRNVSKLWSFSFISACAANFLIGIAFYILMPTLPFYLVEKFHIEMGTVGIIVSSYIVAALLIRPFSGYVVDSFARKPIYIVALVLFITLSFGYLVASSVLFFIVLRFWLGITWGVISTSSNTLAIDIMPSARRGEGIGYFGLMMNLSMALGPMAGLFLYDHYNFVMIFYAAILMGFVGLIFALFIKAPVKMPVKHEVISLDRFLLTNAIPVGLNLILMSVAYGMILSFAAMYGKERGMSHTGLFFTIMAVGMAVSRIFSGKLIDKGKTRVLTIYGIVILSFGFAVFTYSAHPWIYFSAALLMGIGFGIVYPSFQTLFINLGTHQQRGTANSTYFTALDLGIGIGMLVAGKIASFSSLSIAFGVSTLACILSLLYFIFISAPYYDKHKLIE